MTAYLKANALWCALNLCGESNVKRNGVPRAVARSEAAR